MSGRQGHTTASSGIGLGGALFLVMLVLRLTGVYVASWPIIIGSAFAPLAAALSVAAVLIIGTAVVAAIIFAVGFVYESVKVAVK